MSVNTFAKIAQFYRSFSSNYKYGSNFSRFTLNGNRIKPRSLNYISEEHKTMLTIEPIPAHFKLLESGYTVERNGYLLFDFIKFESMEKIDFKSKKTFVMTAKNCDSLLSINITDGI